MFSKPRKEDQRDEPVFRVASSEAPNDFEEVTLSSANTVFFKAFFATMNDFEETGVVSEASLAKFRDSTPLARQRIKELKGMKKTFFKELEVAARKKETETVGESLRFYEALLEADRLRSAKGQKPKEPKLTTS